MLHQFRSADLVRATGIRYHLDISIQPKSGYKLRIIMFQSPKGWDDLNQGLKDNDGERIYVGDGEGFSANGIDKQGGFHLEGGWFTKIQRKEDDETETVIHPAFAELFEWQRKTYNHLEFGQTLDRMKISHPHVRVIHEQRLVITNRTRLPKRKVVNKMYKTSTTWLYPPRVHDNSVLVEKNVPDKKVFFMIIATPLFGGVEDPGQDMMGVDEFGEELPPENDRVQYRYDRQGSVVHSDFGPPVVVKPEPVDEDDPSQGPVAGPSGTTHTPTPARVTWSKSATADVEVVDAPLVDLNQEEDEVRQYVRALEINRKFARGESEARKRDQPAKEKVDKPPKPPKPPKVPKLETNAYGWAYNNTILIRPTFEVFWYNMNRRRGLRL
jgi:hypothetical protein